MGKIIRLPGMQPHPISNRSRHRVSLRVTDSFSPEETRWRLQQIIQNAAGFTANRGFTDKRAIKGSWHTFTVSNDNVANFARAAEIFVRQGLAEVHIAGRPLAVLRRPRRA